MKFHDNCDICGKHSYWCPCDKGGLKETATMDLCYNGPGCQHATSLIEFYKELNHETG